MAPLSTRECNCGEEPTFCPDFPIRYKNIGSPVYHEMHKNFTYGMPNIHYDNEYTYYANNYNEYLDAVEIHRDNPESGMPPLTIFAFARGWQTLGDRPFWDMKARLDSRRNVVIAPLVCCGVPLTDDALERFGGHRHWAGTWRVPGSRIPINMYDPFYSWADSAEAIANLKELSDKIKYFLSTNTGFEYIAENYPNYQHRMFHRNPGTHFNTAIYGRPTVPEIGETAVNTAGQGRYYQFGDGYLNASDYPIFEGQRGVFWPSAPSHPQDTDHTVPIPTINSGVPYGATGAKRGLQGLGGYASTGENAQWGTTDPRFFDEGVIALRWFNSKTQPAGDQPDEGAFIDPFFLFDPAMIDPFAPATGYKYGCQTYRAENWDIHRLAGIRFTGSSTSTWLQTNTLVNQVGPYEYPRSQNGTYWPISTYGTFWLRTSGTGAWTGPVGLPNDTIAKIVSGQWGLCSVGNFQVGARDFSHLGYKNRITPVPHPTNPSICLPLANDSRQGVDTSWTSNSSALKTTPTIIVEQYPDGGGDLIFWDTTKARAWGDENWCDELTTIASPYKKPLCRLIRAQKTAFNSGNRASQSSGPSKNAHYLTTGGWPGALFQFRTGAQTNNNWASNEFAGAQITGSYIIDPVVVGPAVDAGLGPTFNLHTTYGSPIGWWHHGSARATSYMETQTFDPNGNYEEDEYKDWRALIWCKAKVYQARGVTPHGPAALTVKPAPLDGEYDSPEWRALLVNQTKWNHNMMAHAYAGMPCASSTYNTFNDERTPTVNGKRMDYWFNDVQFATAEQGRGPDIQYTLNNSVALRLMLPPGDSARRLTSLRRRSNIYYYPSEERMDEARIWWNTVREDGHAFRDEWNNNRLSDYGDNEHRDNSDDVSRYFQEFSCIPVPMIWVDTKMFFPITHYPFDGQNPEVFTLLTDYYEASNWPTPGNNIYDYNFTNAQCMTLGYGYVIDGFDVPLGVNATDSQTVYAPMFATFSNSNRINFSGAGQIELLLDTDVNAAQRFAAQSSLSKA